MKMLAYRSGKLLYMRSQATKHPGRIFRGNKADTQWVNRAMQRASRVSEFRIQMLNDLSRHADGGVTQPRAGVLSDNALNDPENGAAFRVPDRCPAETQRRLVTLQHELSIADGIGQTVDRKLPRDPGFGPDLRIAEGEQP